jgi:hypothetical protein
MKKSGVIYLVKSDGLLKIGHTSDIEKRLSTLRCSAPDLKLIWSSEQLLNRRDVEKEIHRVMSEFKYKREWFNCDESFAELNCKSVIDSIGELGHTSLDDDEFESKLIDSKCIYAGYLCRVLHDQNLDMISGYIKHSDATDEEIQEFIKKDKAQKIIKAFEYFSKIGFSMLKTNDH